MRVSKTLVFHGPNVWSRSPVLEAWLEPDEGDEALPEAWQACVHRMELALADIRRDGATQMPPPPTLDRADILAWATLALEQLAGDAVLHCWASQRRMVVEFIHVSVALRSLEVALRWIHKACCGEPFSLDSAVQELEQHASEVRLGSTTGPIVAAAKMRGIPAIRLNEDNLVQLGYGARQRRICAAVTSGTGYVAEALSRDKFRTKQLLARLGIPVPLGRVVADAASAWAAACEIGLPVVIKPVDADYGNGVSLRLRTRQEIEQAYALAREFSSSIAVEAMLEGEHHRLLVVGDHVAAGLRREAAQVVGDGRQSIAALVDQANRDPRRGMADDRLAPWFRIAIDDEALCALARQDLRLDSVPAAGRCVPLRCTASGWNGSTLSDVTDDVHPDTAEMVVDAVKAVGLDIAGVDLIAADIRRPLEEQQGGILEINAEPAILIHMSPYSQPSRPVPEAIVAHLFPQAEASRIPIVAVCGSGSDASQAAGRLAEQFARFGHRVGLVSDNGVFVGARKIDNSQCDRVESARTLLMHPRVDALVCQLTANEIRQHGLPFDHCSAALVVNLDGRDDDGCDDFTDADRHLAVEALVDSVTSGGAVMMGIHDECCDQLAELGIADSLFLGQTAGLAPP